MATSIFPVELWQIIFGFACEDEPLLESGMDQDYFVNCEWNNFAGMWWLREPKDIVRRRQMEGYKVKKAIMQTCKLWAQIGTEFMFRSIYVSGPKPLLRLCSLFDRKSHLGSWTRAIHVRSLRHSDTIASLNMEDSLSSLTRQCPDLRYFNVACPLASSYRTVIGTLRFYCINSLTSVQFNVPCDSQARIISAIASMRHLTSLKIELSGPLYDSGRTRSGYGCLVNVELPDLHELVLRGTIQDFSEELPYWELPSLHTLVLDFGNADCDIPDIIDVLSVHGPQLTTLDVNCKIPFDVPDILELCENLRTFCFNLDWRLDGVLTKAPHQHIECIGMYGLQFAFGVGVASQLGQVGLGFIEATVLRNRNNINFASLNRYYFPNLRTLRVLDPEILRGLNASNGPARGGPAHCYERWERWWDMCSRMRVRLEDCAGELLGTLPMEDCGDEDDWEGDEEEEWDDAEDYEDYSEDNGQGHDLDYGAGHPVSSVANGSTALHERSMDVGTSGMSGHDGIRTYGTPPRLPLQLDSLTLTN